MSGSNPFRLPSIYRAVLRIFKYAWESCFMISWEMRMSWV